MRIASIGLAGAVALAVAGAAGALGQSGLTGMVRKGPITPVCVAERPCSAPAAGVTLVFSRGGRDRARATSDRRGEYAVGLAPGAYDVRVLARPRWRALKPAAVRVPVGRVARVNFMLDTGIR
jgi:hypothetical protein